MLKPSSLRAALTAANPELAMDPDKLLVMIEFGSIQSTGVNSLSFEYVYTLNLIITDYAGNPDAVIVPLLAWIRDNQSELLFNSDKRKDGITFEADMLNNASVDLAIKVKLTERVGVHESAGQLSVTHYPEPPLDLYADVDHWQLFIDKELVSEWNRP